jgi:elongation factor P hydroxylase
MRGGAEEEPLYLPNRIGHLAQIRFTRDYVQSELHEVAGVEFRASTENL